MEHSEKTQQSAIRYDRFGIYNVDVDYIEYLHDEVDSEVFFSKDKAYERKPFLGMVIGVGDYKYFIPFSSGKKSHLSWKNSGVAHYVIYEVVKEKNLRKNDIYKKIGEDKYKKILAVLDIKKMIPVPEGLYHYVDFHKVTDLAYRDLLKKEYHFCLGIQDGVKKKVKKVYDTQKKVGKPFKFYCNFSKLEEAVPRYRTKKERERQMFLQSAGKIRIDASAITDLRESSMI